MTAAGIWGDTFRSLRVRNFRLFFIGQFISQSGTWMTMIAQTLLVLDMTGSGVMLGILAACQFGPDAGSRRRGLAQSPTGSTSDDFSS